MYITLTGFTRECLLFSNSIFYVISELVDNKFAGLCEILYTFVFVSYIQTYIVKILETCHDPYPSKADVMPFMLRFFELLLL